MRGLCLGMSLEGPHFSSLCFQASFSPCVLWRFFILVPIPRSRPRHSPAPAPASPPLFPPPPPPIPPLLLPRLLRNIPPIHMHLYRLARLAEYLHAGTHPLARFPRSTLPSIVPRQRVLQRLVPGGERAPPALAAGVVGGAEAEQFDLGLFFGEGGAGGGDGGAEGVDLVAEGSLVWGFWGKGG